MPTFKDNFSKQAAMYAQFRPVYPDELFAWLSTLPNAHELAWDCATGNGQCAVKLAGHFGHVFASDPSEAQILNAYPHEHVTYKVETAERSSLANASVDLLVVAQALHWFDHAAFFAEAKRVLKQDAVIAIISYVNPVVTPEIDALTDQLHDEILKGYWRPENQLIFDQYRSIDFPFEKIPAPAFRIEKELTREAFIGHLRTWSAVQRYIDTNGTNPVEQIEEAVRNLWRDDELKNVCWDLYLIVGRNHQ